MGVEVDGGLEAWGRVVGGKMLGGGGLVVEDCWWKKLYGGGLLMEEGERMMTTEKGINRGMFIQIICIIWIILFMVEIFIKS